MKTFKKITIGFIAVLLLSTTVISVAFASGLITWGGEDNIAYIRETLGFLDGSLKTEKGKNTTNEALISRLRNEAGQKDNQIKSLEEQMQQKINEINEKIAEGNTKVAEKQAELDTLRTQYDQVAAEKSRLEQQVASLHGQNEEVDGRLQQALYDVQVLKDEATAIRSQYEGE